jgi:transcriptional regulator with XRE-family HTH domain
MPEADWARIRAGETPLKVIREYRGLTQKQVSQQSGIAAPEISAIENGRRRGSVDTFKALAKALGTGLDVLLAD